MLDIVDASGPLLSLIWEFTKQISHISGKHASWGHNYSTQTGNNNKLEYKRCVKAWDKNGPGVDDNSHL